MPGTPHQQNLIDFFESYALAFAQFYPTANPQTVEKYIYENVVPAFLDLVSRPATAEPSPDDAFLTIYQYFMQALDRWRIDYLNAISHSQATGRRIRVNIPMTTLDRFRHEYANAINARATSYALASTGNPNVNLRGRAGALYRRQAFHFLRNQRQEDTIRQRQTGLSSAIVDTLQPLSGHGRGQFSDVAFHVHAAIEARANIHVRRTSVPGNARHWDAAAAPEDVFDIPGLSVDQSYTAQYALSGFRNAIYQPPPVYPGNTNANAVGPSGSSEAGNSRPASASATGPTRTSRTTRTTSTPYARPSSGARLVQASQRPANGDAAENNAYKKKSSKGGR